MARKLISRGRADQVGGTLVLLSNEGGNHVRIPQVRIRTRVEASVEQGKACRRKATSSAEACLGDPDAPSARRSPSRPGALPPRRGRRSAARRVWKDSDSACTSRWSHCNSQTKK